jgi:hypothetical protein
MVFLASKQMAHNLIEFDDLAPRLHWIAEVLETS